MGTVAVALALWGAAADPAGVLDRDSWVLAEWMAETADQIEQSFARPVRAADLLDAGLVSLYRAAGQEPPSHFREKLRKADTPGGRMRVLQQARLALGPNEAVDGVRAVIAAAAGFTAATDPYSVLTTSGNVLVASDSELGLGFELDGLAGPNWLAYRLELALGDPRPLTGVTGPADPPAALPWTVRRVIPGGPAARAGLRVGDVVTHLDGTAVTARTHARLFRKLASVTQPDGREPGTTVDASRPVALTVARAGGPEVLKLDRASYTPESVFGVIRRPGGEWDYTLDKAAKVGYVRVGPVEQGADGAFRAALRTLKQDGATGLVLDLRWCPGGYIDPTTKIAAELLPVGSLVASFRLRDGDNVRSEDHRAEPLEGFDAVPVAVLIGPGTAGGGEMIAAALRDHGRGVLVGQRTFGRANVMLPIGTRFPGLAFRASTGYSVPPSGKPRHRFPDSTPFDPWGVRPDPGAAVPLTRDLLDRLGREAEAQAARPADARGAVPFDDPLADPQKAMAVKLLKAGR